MHGRFIVHNIVVIQDLVRQYGRKNVSHRCLMKIVLQTAYDTVDWLFLEEMLQHLGFPMHFVKLVMRCVTTPMFSLLINGNMKGYFKSSRGLRQGDPISPLLFVICMEYLSRVLLKMSEMTQFQFHPRCREVRMTHMCFTDDLILCCKAEFPSAYLILRAFKFLSDSSVLEANVGKSAVYCCGMTDRDVQRIVDAYGFVRSHLPFRYLGVPIYSKRISKAQCELIVEKMTARIRVWRTRNLSYSARTHLFNSVLLCLHRY